MEQGHYFFIWEQVMGDGWDHRSPDHSGQVGSSSTDPSGTSQAGSKVGSDLLGEPEDTLKPWSLPWGLARSCRMKAWETTCTLA